MPRLSLEESAALGLLGPEELARIQYNPFMPRAGGSWTPTLGIRPGLTASNFFRYPGINFRSGISPLRFGLGGLGQGLTLSPESPALGLGGIAAPVGRRTINQQVGRGVAGGVAGGRAGVGAEGSANYVMRVQALPDGRRLVTYGDGRQVLLPPAGRTGQRPVPVLPENYEELQAIGLASRGVGMAQQLARLFGTGGPEAGRTEGPGGVAGGTAGEMVGGGAGGAGPETLAMNPQQIAALGELGINTDLPTMPGVVQPFAGTVNVPNFPTAVPALGPGAGGYTDLSPGSAFWESLRLAPSAPSPGAIGGSMLNLQGQQAPEIFAPPGAEMMPGAIPGGDLALSPAFYAPGGASGADILDASRNLYRVGLRPEDIMEMLPAPAIQPGSRVLDPRGMGATPDIFTPENTPDIGQGFDLNVTPGNTLGLTQNLLGAAQGAIAGDPVSIIKGLLQSGRSLADIGQIPGIARYLSAAGAPVNLVQSIMRGDVPGAIAAAPGLIGTFSTLAPQSFAQLASALNMTPGQLGALGGVGGVLGGGYGLYSAAQKGDPLGILMSAGQLYSSGAPMVNAFGANLPTITDAIANIPGLASALGLTTSVGASAPAALSAAWAPALAEGTLAATTAAEALSAGGAAAGGAGAGAAGGAAAGAAAGALGAAAPIIAFIVSYIGAEEEKAARNAGWANNPIKGALYSQATENVARANKILDSIQQTGGLDAVSTADIGRMLPSAINSMMPYYATAQGPKGAVKASDTITGAGGLTSAKPFMGGQTPAEYTKNAEAAKAGISGLVKELLKRGVTYEQIGQLPVSGDWTQQTLDAAGTPDAFLSELPPEQRNRLAQEGAGLYSRYFAGKSGPMMLGSAERETMPQTPEQQTEAMLGIALGSSMLAPEAVTKASGLYTQMYGGPLWAALARMGVADPELRGLMQQHFDPWVIARTPEFIQSWTAPRLTQEDLNNYEAQHGSGSAAAAGLQVGAIIPGSTGGRQLTAEDLANYEAAHGVPLAGYKVGDWIAPPTPPASAAPPAPSTFWDDLAKQQAQRPTAPTGPTAFNPLSFLSALQGGQKVNIQAGPETLTFIPYKPGQGATYQAKDSGYQQIGEGYYVKPSGQQGLEVYVPQDTTQEALGKALSGSQGASQQALAAALMASGQVPAGQETGATPGAGPATDITPQAVPAGTAATAPAGSTPGSTAPADATQPLPGTGFKKGGMVPKTGEYLVHKGEVIIPADKANPGEGTDFLEDMAKQGELSLPGKEDRKLQMPKMGPGRLDRGFGPGPDGGSQPDDEAKAPAAPKWYVHMRDGVPTQDLDGTDPNVRRLAFTPEDVRDALDAGEAPVLVGKAVLAAPPSLQRQIISNAQKAQFADPMKNPAVVRMAADFKDAQGMKPEGDTLPYPGLGEQILRGNRPRFTGDRGRGADVPLDRVPQQPSFAGPNDAAEGPQPTVPGTGDRMPRIRMAPPLGNPFMVRPAFARAMRVAQNAAQPQQPVDRMLQDLDTGAARPSTLREAIGTQKQYLTPQDIMNMRGTQPGLTPQPATQPGLFEQAIRRLRG